MRRTLAAIFAAVYERAADELLIAGRVCTAGGMVLGALAEIIRGDIDDKHHADPAPTAERKAAHSDLEAAFARARRVYPQHFGARNELGGSIRVPPRPRRPFGFN